MYGCSYCKHVDAPHVYLVLVETRRGYQMPGTWFADACVLSLGSGNWSKFSRRVASALGCTIFPASALPTPPFFLIYFGKLVLKNPPFCSVCKFSSVPLNSPQYLCRDTEKKIKTTKCIGYAAKFLLSVHKALGPIASAKEKKNVLSSSLLICALIYSLNTYCQH